MNIRTTLDNKLIDITSFGRDTDREFLIASFIFLPPSLILIINEFILIFEPSISFNNSTKSFIFCTYVPIELGIEVGSPLVKEPTPNVFNPFSLIIVDISISAIIRSILL